MKLTKQDYKPSGIISEEYPEKVKVAYLQGYEQAEKDLALTWEDASVIVTIAMDIIGEGEIHGEQNIYTEVLKRFNEQRTK